MEDIKKIYSVMSRVIQDDNTEGEMCVVSGKVIHGNKQGRTVGFPTANLEMEDYTVLPEGSYIAKVEVDSVVYSGIFNMETRFNMKDNVRENSSAGLHLFGFSGEIYGVDLEVSIVKEVDKKTLKGLVKISNSIRKK